MFAALKIVLALTAILGSNLSGETVTKEKLAKKEFPIRVMVSPSIAAGMITLRFEFDHTKVAPSGWADVELEVKHSTSKAKIARVPVEISRNGDKTKTIAELEVDPEFAITCDVVISSWIGSNEHEYRIPLKLFTEEMKDEQKAAKK